jgi:uncharacterized Fe-S cluster protein YjdI/CDGSH-type Zn-finger protein
MTTRIYEADDLQVIWDSQRCLHVAACIRALPRVFNPLARPWIRIHAADANAIIDAIERCPTGALRYARRNGPAEAPAVPTTIEVIPDGPLLLRGDLEVVTADGAPITRETRLALCRCGASANKPFCDNSHRRIGFATSDGAVAAVPADDTASPEQRDRAESPAEVGPPQSPSFRAP